MGKVGEGKRKTAKASREKTESVAAETQEAGYPETRKKAVVVKRLKPRRTVSFGKKKTYYKRQEQEEKLYEPDTRYRRQPAGLTPEQLRARMVGSRGDPKTTFKLDPQGRLIQVARKRGKVRVV